MFLWQGEAAVPVMFCFNVMMASPPETTSRSRAAAHSRPWMPAPSPGEPRHEFSSSSGAQRIPWHTCASSFQQHHPVQVYLGTVVYQVGSKQQEVPTEVGTSVGRQVSGPHRPCRRLEQALGFGSFRPVHLGPNLEVTRAALQGSCSAHGQERAYGHSKCPPPALLCLVSHLALNHRRLSCSAAVSTPSLFGPGFWNHRFWQSVSIFALLLPVSRSSPRQQPAAWLNTPSYAPRCCCRLLISRAPWQ